MKSVEIRQSFLDFFNSKKHEIVHSAPLLPESPNLLFTNAGMNQFVPYFLGDQHPPFNRVADTQKCIRAGGKHNDLEDVGFDTYHHTFFEMLGNWSFGDYFKKDAIKWAWDLLVETWNFPPERMYATVYHPEANDPAEFDHEAHEIWSEIFKSAGLDPSIHVVSGGKKDNFWMMGETGPCGPCSEIHLDLTPDGDSAGKLVNADSHLCIEIWNLVFIQFNADTSGNFSHLSAKHVDTGMGFERVAAVIQSTKGFTDFSKPTSNYDTDVFSPIFDKIEELSNKRYKSTLPGVGKPTSQQEEIDIAYRVIGDHLRALCFSIADGILPGNTDRNYVLRRILRRGVKYGRTLGFNEPFFHLLAPTLIKQLESVFPEIKKREELICKTLKSEESSFNKTLDRGMELFNRELSELNSGDQVSGTFAFKLYDTYGFPLDLTELLARESGINIDTEGFEKEMNAQKKRAREAHKSVVVQVSESENSDQATEFLGFEKEKLTNCESFLQETISLNGNPYIIFDKSPFYAEMGGQQGDEGTVFINDQTILISDVIKDSRGRFLHKINHADSPTNLSGKAFLSVNLPRRQNIQCHHTATHILHWALREILGDHIKQSGSLVEHDRLRFDFSHFEGLSDSQLEQIESLANEKLLLNEEVKSYEIPFSEKPDEVVAFFGEKYGETVRVVNLGGWSQELCGGTHVSNSGEIGSIRIISESAISAGNRRIEAVAGKAALSWTNLRISQLNQLVCQLACKPGELSNRISQLQSKNKELEKKVLSFSQKNQTTLADDLIKNADEIRGIRIIKAKVENLATNELRPLAAQINKRTNPSVVVLVSESNQKCGLICICSKQAIEAGYSAGEILGELAGKLGGKGGGKPDFAMGGSPASSGIGEALKSLSVFKN
jgi:alanyl-tRNA synthetase